MKMAHPTAEAIARYVRDCSAPKSTASGGRQPPVDSTSPATTVDDRLCRVLKHINARLAEHLDLDEIAAAVCIPRRTLTWLVRREMGCSVGELVTWLRLRKAMELLAVQEKSITNVALEAGYSSANKMANHFARYLGVSPRDYRATRARSASQGNTPARSASEGGSMAPLSSREGLGEDRTAPRSAPTGPNGPRRLGNREIRPQPSEPRMILARSDNFIMTAMNNSQNILQTLPKSVGNPRQAALS